MILNREPILSPTDTIKIDAVIIDSSKLTTADYYGNYSFSFQPSTADDHQRLFEAAESALMEVQHMTPTYSHYSLRQNYETKQGLPFCSQKYLPLFNEEVYNGTMLIGRQASLTLFFKDANDGNIYLNCDFLDLYDELNGYDEEYMNPSGRVCDFAW